MVLGRWLLTVGIGCGSGRSTKRLASTTVGIGGRRRRRELVVGRRCPEPEVGLGCSKRRRGSAEGGRWDVGLRAEARSRRRTKIQWGLRGSRGSTERRRSHADHRSFELGRRGTGTRGGSHSAGCAGCAWCAWCALALLRVQHEHRALELRCRGALQSEPAFDARLSSFRVLIPAVRAEHRSSEKGRTRRTKRWRERTNERPRGDATRCTMALRVGVSDGADGRISPSVRDSQVHNLLGEVRRADR